MDRADAEYRAVWGRFYAHFQFRPDYYERHSPAIIEPTPCAVINLFGEFDARSIDSLNELFLGAFRTATNQNENLYALDWQHTSYWFHPFHDTHPWRLSVYPNGDYYAFLAADFSFGTFGHPWQQTLCVF